MNYLFSVVLIIGSVYGVVNLGSSLFDNKGNKSRNESNQSNNYARNGYGSNNRLNMNYRQGGKTRKAGKSKMNKSYRKLK